MAKSKQTIARFIDEYEAYLISIKGSISRVEKEHDLWVRQQKSLEDNWAGTPVVANLVASHPQDAWWAALEKSTNPDLQNIRQKAEKKVADLVQNQQFAKDKILECTALGQSMGTKLAEADTVLGAANEKRQAADTVLVAAKQARSDFHDSWTETHVKKWERQGVASRSPMDYDYSAPQPWWAKPWLLAVTNPEMAGNMKEAARFQERTGKSLYEVVQGYKQRAATLQDAQEGANSANRDYKRVEQVYNSLAEAKQNNENELQRSIDWVFPETGPKSLAAQSQHVRTTAVENAAKYCIMNNVAEVSGLALVLPDAQEYAQRAGKLAAMQKVTESLSTATANWRKGETGVEGALEQLNKLARKHSRHTKVSIDTDTTQKMTRDIEKASISTHGRFKAARPMMSQSTPFASRSFSGNNDTVVHTTTTNNSNDSMFWTMAWMYLLMSPSPATAIEQHSNGLAPSAETGALPLLDPQQFESDFQNANGGLGLPSTITFEDLSLPETGISVDSDRSWSSDGGGGSFSVDIPDVQIDTSSVSSSSGSSWSSSSDSYSSSSSSGSSCSSSSSSSGSSCSSSSGSSCGGGGGD